MPEAALIVVDVLDDIERTHQVESGVGERQGGHFAEHHVGTAAAQLLERRRTDVDELRAEERQSRPETGRDMLSSAA